MRALFVMALACLIAACASSSDLGTLKSLERRHVAVERDVAIEASRVAAIQAYQKFLDAAPRDRLRPEAMRRLGDLEIERAQEDTESADTRQYRDAIKVYQDLLRAYPKHAGNDRVLYQLSHAYDQIGDLPNALAALDRLFAEHPSSIYHGEAAFRRGELLFSLRRYGDAQRAYESVLRSGESPALHERALYMHGWSLFKQMHLEQGLHSFFAVLDRKLIGRHSDAPLEEIPGLARGERELVDDTFRVVSLSFANLRGADSIPSYFLTPGRHEYEFRVYQQLGELFLKQERVEDAAETLNAFARRYPTHVQAPILQSRVIEAYQQSGFGALALETKKEFVVRYGVSSEFRRVNDVYVYERVLPYVKTHLEELARHYHATAQKGKKREDYQEAVRWYRAFLDSFPTDARVPGMTFLLAELLFEDRRYAPAAAEYERAAYDYPRHAKTADAGYAALLAYAQQEKLATGDQSLVKRRAVESAIRFADANPKDSRTAGVLTDTAEKLYAMHDQENAMAIAQRVLALEPPATTDQRRTAWTVMAHVAFQQGSFHRAERGYQEVLALTPEKSSTRDALSDRLAASIYKQGEQARSTGQLSVAAAHFLRVGKSVPMSPIRANAEYDAAAVLIALKDWDGAARVLEDFRRDHPKHALQSEVPGKLALVYLESGQALKAAAEFEVLASSNKSDIGLSREALWQAAELYEKAGHERNAAVAYERYARQHVRPFEPAIEARYRLAEISRKQGQTARHQAWSRELVEMEQKGGGERTDRTRYLGAVSAMVMAGPIEESYRSVRLVEPLRKNLKLKKEKMEQALQAYGIAAEYGVADAATAATFRTAELYNDFGRAMLESQRPKGLNKDELEQYNVLLEEQAFPFEEKAIELHEINAQRVRKGMYDDWVKRSFAALSKLRPVRYAKSEKSEGAIRALH